MCQKHPSETEDDDELPYKDLLEWLALLLCIIEMLSHLL